MSGTSMDGVDASIVQSDGKYKYKGILDKYFKYPRNIYKNLTTLRDKIKSSKDLKKNKNGKNLYSLRINERNIYGWCRCFNYPNRWKA